VELLAGMRPLVKENSAVNARQLKIYLKIKDTRCYV